MWRVINPKVANISNGVQRNAPTGIVIGTRNKHKVREIKTIYSLLVPRYPSGDYSELSRRMSGNSFPDTPPLLNIRFIPLSNFNPPAVKENAKTYIENATKKAASFAKHTGYLTLAEDSGIEVKTLNWKPGIYSARYASTNKNRNTSDRDNNQKLLDELAGLPFSKRIARYRCAAVVVSPSGKILAKAEGTCWGRIAFSPKGKNGFGYDPIFIPDEQPSPSRHSDVPRCQSGDSVSKSIGVNRSGCTQGLGVGQTFGQLPTTFKHTISHRGKALKNLFLKLEKTVDRDSIGGA